MARVTSLDKLFVNIVSAAMREAASALILDCSVEPSNVMAPFIVLSAFWNAVTISVNESKASGFMLLTIKSI